MGTSNYKTKNTLSNTTLLFELNKQFLNNSLVMPSEAHQPPTPPQCKRIFSSRLNSTAAVAAELIQYPRLLPPLTQTLHLGTRCAVAGLLCRIISSSSPSHFISRACATSLRWGTSTTNNNLLSGQCGMRRRRRRQSINSEKKSDNNPADQEDA